MPMATAYSVNVTVPFNLHGFSNSRKSCCCGSSLQQIRVLRIYNNGGAQQTPKAIKDKLFGSNSLSLLCDFPVRATAKLSKPISAVGSGLEASITDPNDKAITLKNAEIVVESQTETQMQIRVDLTGDDTQRAFDVVLADLAHTAPPIPGFRRQKGGKTSKVPKDFLLQMLGEDRVTKFVIQEIVTSTMADYVKKQNLRVKDNKISTIQTAEELKSSFIPGGKFGFTATLELERLDANANN